MKTKVCCLLLFSCAGLLGSCNLFSTGASLVGVVATGLPYEIVVVAEEKLWGEPAGEAVKDALAAPVLGLPQYEPAMRVMHVDPSQFDGMMKYVRNILILHIDPAKYTKVSFSAELDTWAALQVVATITSPDTALLIQHLADHPRQIVDYFTKTEMRRVARGLRNKHNPLIRNLLNDKFQITLCVPEDVNTYKDTTDFFWASNNANTGRIDVVVYTFPHTDENTFTQAYLVNKRNEILGKYIPGAFPNSHMATDTMRVTYNSITLNGKYCGVLRGLWHMQGDMMGGPFVSYARADEANRRIVVTEGFVYAPETDKRNYIRRIEAALNTLLLPGESDDATLPTNPD